VGQARRRRKPAAEFAEVSPSSGANAEANTRPTTLGTPVAAPEITAPP
jgi:hypothetical protein